MMKVLGLLGGMSWESTIPYYRTINEQVKARLGGLHSAKIVLYSVDFQEVERLQHRGDWGGASRLLAAAAVALRAAGAEAIVICTNTMHKVAEAVEQASGLPLIHIADATALQVREKHSPRRAAGHAFYHGADLLSRPPAGIARHRCGDAGQRRSRHRTPHHL